MEITYTKRGDYYYPDLALPKQEKDFVLNRYGRERLNFLKQNKKAVYQKMLMDCTLTKHLKEVQIKVEKRQNELIERMKKEENITEKLKMEDQLKWVGFMNNIKNCADEIIRKEIIYN